MGTRLWAMQGYPLLLDVEVLLGMPAVGEPGRDHGG